jgi:hypothetical protein
MARQRPEKLTNPLVGHLLLDRSFQREVQADLPPGKHLVCYSQALLRYVQRKAQPPDTDAVLAQFVVRCPEDVAGVLMCDETHPFFQYLVRNGITIGRTLLPSELGPEPELHWGLRDNDGDIER